MPYHPLRGTGLVMQIQGLFAPSLPTCDTSSPLGTRLLLTQLAQGMESPQLFEHPRPAPISDEVGTTKFMGEFDGEVAAAQIRLTQDSIESGVRLIEAAQDVPVDLLSAVISI